MDSSLSSTDRPSTDRLTAVETPFDGGNLLASGLLALQQQQYQEAIGILEAFCHDCAAQAQLDSRDYLRAQMHLITTYNQQGQPDRALALCHNLTRSSNAQVKIWAEQKLKTIDPNQARSQTQPPLLLAQLKRWFLTAVS